MFQPFKEQISKLCQRLQNLLKLTQKYYHYEVLACLQFFFLSWGYKINFLAKKNRFNVKGDFDDISSATELRTTAFQDDSSWDFSALSVGRDPKLMPFIWDMVTKLSASCFSQTNISQVSLWSSFYWNSFHLLIIKFGYIEIGFPAKISVNFLHHWIGFN